MSHEIFLKSLETGEKRSAYRNAQGEWVADTDVKAKILNLFKESEVISMGAFLDKAPLKPRQFTLEDKVRMVPGGSSVRAGAFIAPGVVMMPPSYVNIGAYVDEATMIDSHVLIGSCAQIGKRVHLSTAVQIGGVLEPIGQRPVVVEDDCFIGAGVILTEGIVVRKGAVIAPGVSLSAAVPVYDTIQEKVIKGEIPENAVVVPGSRPSKEGSWARAQGLTMNCAVIVKYRDEKTQASVALESALR